MTDEQFPWFDWPNGDPPNPNQNAARSEGNSDTQWGSPFYNPTSTPTAQAQESNNGTNNSNGQSQYYPSYQKQGESYVRLEDVQPYPSYRWGPPPNRDYQRQTVSYSESTWGLPAAALPVQQSPKRTAGRQLPNQMPQASPTESHVGKDLHSNNEAKRRRLDPPITSQASSQTASKANTLAHTQAIAHMPVQNTRPSAQYNSTSSNGASRPSMPPISQRETQPATQYTASHSSHQTARLGSQYVSSAQSQPTSNVPPRTASPAVSQASSQRAPQAAIPAQSKAQSRVISSGSPQTTAAHIPRPQSQYASPKITSQALQQTAPPSAQTAAQRITQPNSQYTSPSNKPLTLPQTVPRAATHATQQTARSASQHIPRPSPQTSQHLLPPTQSAMLPVSHQVPHGLPSQRPPSTQQAATGPTSARPQPIPQMAQAQHTQLPHKGPYGNLSDYTYKPEDPADKSYLKQRRDIVTRLNEEDAAKKIAYDPKTIARDILISAGRHPTEPCLNHHFIRIKDNFTAVEVNSDLATFRWDLVDPAQSSRARPSTQKNVPRQAPFAQTRQTAPPPAVQVAQPVNNNFANYHPLGQQPTFQQQLPPRAPPPQYKPKIQPATSQPQPPPQRQPPSQPQPTQAPVSKPTPKPAPVPAPARAPAPLPQPPAVILETPKRPDSTMEKRRRGRPPGSTKKPKAVASAAAAPPPPAAVSYPVFACRWKDCQAKLHNLDTLKKHIFKHVSRSIVCAWKDCNFKDPLPATELMKHLRQSHLKTLAWKLGDGPVIPTSVDQDSSARTVPLTIPESNQPGNEDSLIFPADIGSIRAFNRVHGNIKPEEKAGEIMKAVQRLKEHVGVGLDPGGCELATPQRNQRVSNDEDVYEVRSAN